MSMQEYTRCIMHGIITNELAGDIAICVLLVVSEVTQTKMKHCYFRYRWEQI